MTSSGQELASIALHTGALRLSPLKPFRWASGYYMPIYNDNRLLLSDYKHRMIVKDGFLKILETLDTPFDTIGGIATGGISPATTLADCLKLPFLYVRSSAKEHGTKKEIEGKLSAGDKILLVEDVVSTGGSSLKALESVRRAGGDVSVCFSVFSYGFQQALNQFLKSACSLHALLTLDLLLEVAKDENHLSANELDLVKQWRLDPFSWGESNGYHIDKNS